MSKINKKQAAQIIENQVFDALKIKFDRFNSHPIRLIQASKSLIGLNLENPNMNLLDFNSDYLKNNNKNLMKDFKRIDLKPNEVITTYDIEEAFISKDKKAILLMLNQLSLVSSELHILECLIEISLKQTGSSFLVLWSIYKSILFVNKQVNQLFLSIAIDAILSDKFEDLVILDSDFSHDNIISNKNLSYNFLDLYSHLLEAYNSDLIRENKIKNLIKNIIFRRLGDIELNHFSEKKSIDYPHLLSSGRFWLSDFLKKIDKQKFTIEFILFLDFIRCLFRFLDSKEHKFICFYFQKNIKDFNV